MSKFKSRYFYYRLTGDYALFTEPSTKGGGERYSYSVPTHEALRGITSKIYWKPTIQIVIDEVKVINQIKRETHGVRTLTKTFTNNQGVDRVHYTYLKDVEYLVKFHIEWNEGRLDLAHDRNAGKHMAMMERSIERGGRLPIFLGISECRGYVESLTEDDYLNTQSIYDGVTIPFGLMFNRFYYGDDGEVELETNTIMTTFADVTMVDGVINYESVEEVTQHIHKYQNQPNILAEDLVSIDVEYETMIGSEVIG